MRKQIIILISILSVVVCFLVLIGIWLRPLLPGGGTPTYNGQDKNDFSRYIKPKIEPDSIFMVTGLITKILPDERRLVIKAESARNLFLTDKEFEVAVATDAKVCFTKLVEGREEIVPFNQLQVGQIVIVSSENNAQKNKLLSTRAVYVINGPTDVDTIDKKTISNSSILQ